jgi:hypothetical protein
MDGESWMVQLPLTILWCSKFVVGCYVIICAIYLARLIEHLLQVSGRGKKGVAEERGCGRKDYQKINIFGVESSRSTSCILGPVPSIPVVPLGSIE